MDEAQIKQLIADSISTALKEHSKALLDDVTEYMDNRTQALEDTINAASRPNNDESPSETPKADEALTARLALLEKELNETKTARENQEKESVRLKFANTVQSSINALPGVLHADVLSELMVNRLSEGYTVKDGSFITRNGKTIDEEVQAFVSTDAGKHFLQPKQQAKGSDNPTPQRTRAEAAKSLTQALLRK